MDNVFAQLKREWIREDRTYLAYLQKTLPEFETLYLKYFHKPLYRQVNRMVIEDIVSEIKQIKERLFPVKSGVTYKLVSVAEDNNGKLESTQHPADSRCLVGSMA
ncbi:MAG: hypothetical protein WDL87_01940 [Candidatus Omnitrophota bacterium]|jgi:hypothetical protein